MSVKRPVDGLDTVADELFLFVELRGKAGDVPDRVLVQVVLELSFEAGEVVFDTRRWKSAVFRCGLEELASSSAVSCGYLCGSSLIVGRSGRRCQPGWHTWLAPWSARWPRRLADLLSDDSRRIDVATSRPPVACRDQLVERVEGPAWQLRSARGVESRLFDSRV